jgi:hypothetical protein
MVQEGITINFVLLKIVKALHFKVTLFYFNF